jgi:TRAP-type C4-dicarboxylate transport system permease small subunit
MFRTALGLLTGTMILVYCAVVTIWGVQLMAVGTMQVSPAMQLNMALVYSVFPFAGLLMVIESALATFGNARKVNPE